MLQPLQYPGLSISKPNQISTEMASKTSLNAKNLESLGAARLAELLMDLCQGNAAAKRALRLALAEQGGAADMAQQVRKRLATIARSGSWLDKRRRDELLADLERQRQAIVGPIAGHDGELAMELLWRFLDLAESLLDRCDDSDEAALGLFHLVTADLGRVACLAQPAPAALADQVAVALLDNDYGQYDQLVPHLKEALTPEGLLHLRQLLEAKRPPSPAQADQEDELEELIDSGLSDDELLEQLDLLGADTGFIYISDFDGKYEPGAGEALDAGFNGSSDPNSELDSSSEADAVFVGTNEAGADFDGISHPDAYENLDVDFKSDFDENSDSDVSEHRQAVRLAMLAIADALDDAESYLAEYRDHHPVALRLPGIAAQVAGRLTAAGRAADALLLLEAAEPYLQNRPVSFIDWLDGRIAALEALARHSEAQALRWSWVERSLSIRHLRDYLKALPAFEDVEAEERAFDLVFAYPSFDDALQFLHQWPDQRRAARLILARSNELDGYNYELLSAVAEALAAQQPLAATLCLRAMVDFSLDMSRSSRYKHAVRHLATCDVLAAKISDWAGHDNHATYRDRLGLTHHQKYGFWEALGEPPWRP